MPRHLPHLTVAALAAAVALLAVPTVASAATHTKACEGSSKRCTATFPLSATKDGDRLVVELPDTDLQLRAIVPSSSSLTSKYGFGGMSTSVGGSVFTARLLRFGGVPRSASLELRFFVAPAMRSCGTARADAGDSTVRVRRVEAHGVRCAAARRIAAGCVAGTGPSAARWTIFQVDDLVSFQRGARRVTFAAGAAGATCVPVG